MRRRAPATLLLPRDERPRSDRIDEPDDLIPTSIVEIDELDPASRAVILRRVGADPANHSGPADRRRRIVVKRDAERQAGVDRKTDGRRRKSAGPERIHSASARRIADDRPTAENGFSMNWSLGPSLAVLTAACSV